MIGRLTLRSLSYSTEDPEKVARAISSIVGDIELRKRTVKGHFGNPVVVITGEAGRKKAEKIFEGILRSLGKKDRERLKEELQKRLDEENNLHLRFDKQIAYSEGVPRLTSHGDAIHIRVKLILYSKGKDELIKKMEEMIDAC